MAQEEAKSPAGKALNFADAARFSTRDEDEAAARGADIPVVFDLPDGKEEAVFSLGHSVDMLKWHLTRAKGYQYAAISFTLDGQVMIDPLSLADFPSIAETRRATIKVSVAEGGAGDDESKTGAGGGGKEAEDNGGGGGKTDETDT